MKPFTKITALFLFLVALIHLVRLISGWEILVNGNAIPLWASVIGMIIPSFLAVMLYRESKK